MKTYRVLEYFTDLQDDNYEYHVGDIFPRDGLIVPKKRINELSSAKNKRKRAVIEEVKDND